MRMGGSCEKNKKEKLYALIALYIRHDSVIVVLSEFVFSRGERLKLVVVVDISTSAYIAHGHDINW